MGNLRLDAMSRKIGFRNFFASFFTEKDSAIIISTPCSSLDISVFLLNCFVCYFVIYSLQMPLMIWDN